MCLVVNILLLVATGPLAVAAGQNEEVEEPWVTYLHLWQAILLPDMPDKPTVSSRSSRGPKLGLFKEDDDPEQLGLQQQAVYDALMRAVMDAVRNLDLEYHQAQAGVGQEAVAKATSPDSKELSKQARTANNSHKPQLVSNTLVMRPRLLLWKEEKSTHMLMSVCLKYAVLAPQRERTMHIDCCDFCSTCEKGLSGLPGICSITT